MMEKERKGEEFMVKLTYVRSKTNIENFRFYVSNISPKYTILDALPDIAERIKQIDKFREAPSLDSIVIKDTDGDRYDNREPLTALEKFSLVYIHDEEHKRLSLATRIQSSPI